MKGYKIIFLSGEFQTFNLLRHIPYITYDYNFLVEVLELSKVIKKENQGGKNRFNSSFPTV